MMTHRRRRQQQSVPQARQQPSPNVSGASPIYYEIGSQQIDFGEYDYPNFKPDPADPNPYQKLQGVY